MAWDATWVGTSDTDFGTAGNWSPSGIPTAADELLVPTATNAIAGSDETAVALTRVYFDETCDFDVGSSGSPLILDCTYVECRGTGARFIKGGGTNGISWVVVRMNDNSQPVTLYPNTTTKITNVLAYTGNVTIAAEAGAVTLVKMMSGGGANLSVANGGGGVTTLVHDGDGLVKSNDTIATCHANRGRLVQDQDTITTLYVAATANVEYRTAGTIATAVVAGHRTLDLLSNGNAKTITTLAREFADSVIENATVVAITNEV